MCSTIWKPHITLADFVNGADKGQYKNNKACFYPGGFAEYIAERICNPLVSCKIQKCANLQDAMPVGPNFEMDKPPASHYLTHLPKLARMQSLYEL